MVPLMMPVPVSIVSHDQKRYVTPYFDCLDLTYLQCICSHIHMYVTNIFAKPLALCNANTGTIDIT